MSIIALFCALNTILLPGIQINREKRSCRMPIVALKRHGRLGDLSLSAQSL